ncbi:hypothetical protein ACHAXR_010774 [Thalassiosira sp. AJA248-18]
MTDPAPQKYLSFSAILVLAANTMNGPGITTLPDVAADAGLCLYVTLIAISVSMAAFVCRRMVYAMWSSLDEEAEAGVDDVEKQPEDYDSMKKVDSGIIQSLAIDSSDKDAAVEEAVGETDEIIPGVTSGGKDESSQLIHREHDHDGEPQHDIMEEAESLLSHKDHQGNIAMIGNYNKSQPLLERTSIVGQSREAYGKKTSVYVAFTMVASALCLGLAQMMLCAAILDGMFVAVGGKSCALGWPSSEDETSSWIHCTTHSSMKPYAGSGAPMSLISIGWVIAASASVAMGTVDLDEMMGVQYFLFGCLVVSALRFSAVLKNMADGMGGDITMAEVNDNGDSMERMLLEEEDGSSAVNWFVGPNPFNTVGPIMFNFAFIVTSPPSSAMAKKDTIAYMALGMSCVVMGTLYTIVGLSGASVSNAVRNGMIKGGDDSNLLSLILLSGGGDGGPSVFDLFMIALFGFSTIASVPVYCLLAKETLINDAGVAPLPSFLLSNVLPWILVAATYNAAFFEAFVNWSGLLILGYANFSIPLLLDLKLKRVRALRAVSKMIQDEGERTAAITKGVFILVTASITLVIVMSISNSLTMATVAFLFMVGVMVHVRV